MFNENYLKNQDLMNELEMTISQDKEVAVISMVDSSMCENINMEEVIKIIKKVGKLS